MSSASVAVNASVVASAVGRQSTDTPLFSDYSYLREGERDRVVLRNTREGSFVRCVPSPVAHHSLTASLED